MTLTQLQYLIAVDNHRHFAQAAAASFVTQPTLSMQVQKLEDELDVLLFDRSKYPVRPTAIGEKIIKQARNILHETERIDQILQESKNTLEGSFKLGIIPTVGASLVPRFIGPFFSKYPKIQLQVIELTTEQILERIRRDELDAAILATPLREKGIIEKPLFYEPFVSFIPANHPMSKEQFITNSELDLDDLLLLNEGHCFRNSVLNLCGQNGNGERKVNLESGNFETLIKLSKKGFGMTLLPHLHALELNPEDQKLVKPIADPRPTREISLIYTRAELKIKAINALAEVIMNNVPQNLLEEKDQVLSPRLN